MTLILESSSTVREELQAKRNDETDAPQRSWSRGNWQLWGIGGGGVGGGGWFGVEVRFDGSGEREIFRKKTR